MKRIEFILKVLLTLFAVFMLYQIARVVFGGSWTTEDILLGLVILNVGMTFTMGIIMSQMRADLNHLSKQFSSLARDFKSHMLDDKRHLSQ
jgi:hypothetical protein